MSEKKTLNPIDILNPLKVLEVIDSAINSFDKVLKNFDNVLASVDERLLRKPAELVEEIETTKTTSKTDHVPSPSYPGQTVENYCLECLSRHYLKAVGLLEEAERFSMSKGEITPEGRQRIELALKEIVTAEEDLGTEIRDPELARMIEEIKVEQRNLRKWMWAERLLTTQKDISKLREAISRMKNLVDMTRRAAEYYDSKYGRCNYCEQLAKEVSEKFSIAEQEVLEAIYGLASDDRERVRESAEKLKKLGVFEYVMGRVKQMLEEMKEGK